MSISSVPCGSSTGFVKGSLLSEKGVYALSPFPSRRRPPGTIAAPAGFECRHYRALCTKNLHQERRQGQAPLAKRQRLQFPLSVVDAFGRVSSATGAVILVAAMSDESKKHPSG